MITAIYSLGKVEGAWLVLLFMFLCAAAYTVGCLLVRDNRSKRGIITVLIGLFSAEAAIDVLWAAIFYSDGVYHNYGMGGVLWLLIPIFVLFIAAVLVRAANKRKK